MKFPIAISTALFALASVVAASSVAQIKQDIRAIDADVLNLFQHCHVEHLTVLVGAGIREAANKLILTLKASSKDVMELKGSPTEKDVEDMLSLLAKTEDKVKGTVAKIEFLKPEFKKLGFLQQATEFVNEFKEETQVFSAQLVKLAPAKHHDTAVKLEWAFNRDLAECAAVYNGQDKPQMQAGGQAGGKIGGKIGGKSRLSTEQGQ